MEIRSYRNSDYVEIADLFHDSVHAIDDSYYTKAQLEAWAPTPPDYELWKQRLALKEPFVALEGSKIVGFIELEENGHIDCLYVHKEYQGKGVASTLLQYLSNIAKTKGITNLHVEASKVAMPLFKKFGFELKKVNKVSLRGQSLLNYSMSSTSQP